MRFSGYGNASVWRTMRPNVWDVAALILVFGALVLIVYGVEQTAAPLAPGPTTVSLDPAHLPYYALRTTLRMLAAIVCSTIFTLIYAAVAAKSRRAEIVLIPLLDILQSVPILGFLTFTVVFFLNLFPGRVLGAELASVFAIFTSQAWNMTFSLYQSLRTVPKDLDEAARAFRLSAWQRFWRLDLPFGMPGLVWNAMMSMSGGWFFVIASEAISVGSTTITLPGIGSYVALAIEQKDLADIVYAIVAMLLVIVLYDQLLFRPIVAWANKFRFEQTASAETPSSWVLDLFRRTRALRAIARAFAAIKRRIADDLHLPLPASSSSPGADDRISRPLDALWIAFVSAVTVYAAWLTYRYLSATLGPNDLMVALREGLVTLVRVAVLIVLATLVWVPIGVWIGLRPRIAERIQPAAQFLAAFPANLAFPVFVVAIVRLRLDADIWLSPLMILGTQWYILFNVISGARVFRSDLREAADSLHLRGWRWWVKVILPGIFPYYVTGAITASGGSWNAAIVAEVASWGDTHLHAIGLGSYIAAATEAGDYPRVVLGIATMCVFVTLFNRLVWRPLYAFGERRLRLG